MTCTWRFVQTVKKVESFEQVNILSVILSEAQCAKEKRIDFLRIEKGLCNNTVWSYMMPF